MSPVTFDVTVDGHSAHGNIGIGIGIASKHQPAITYHHSRSSANVNGDTQNRKKCHTFPQLFIPIHIRAIATETELYTYFAFPTMTLTMLRTSNRSSYFHCNSDSLASSVMMISISEDAVDQNVARLHSSCSVETSCDRLGWGNEATRTSYKRDLSSLGDCNAPNKRFAKQRTQEDVPYYASPSAVAENNDTWGFYDDESDA